MNNYGKEGFRSQILQKYNNSADRIIAYASAIGLVAFGLTDYLLLPHSWQWLLPVRLVLSLIILTTYYLYVSNRAARFLFLHTTAIIIFSFLSCGSWLPTDLKALAFWNYSVAFIAMLWPSVVLLEKSSFYVGYNLLFLTLYSLCFYLFSTIPFIDHLYSGGMFILFMMFVGPFVAARRRSFFEENVSLSYALHEKNNELEKTNNRLEKQSRLLREANETKDTFFSILGHDLKNPFFHILNYSQIIKKRFLTNKLEGIEETVKLLEASTLSTYKLFDNIMQWAKTQKGLVKPVPKRLNIVQVFNKVIESLQGEVKSKQIEIEIDDIKAKTVYADNDLLQTIVRNLLSNAIKHSKPQGKITLSVEPVQDGSGTLVSVRDEGGGVDEDLKNELWNIIPAVDGDSRQNGKAGGLGLHLCKEFVDMHGGTIGIKNISDQGCVFFFTLPSEKVAGVEVQMSN